MDLTPLLGLLLYVVGGATGASFYLPFKKVRHWAWESYWLVYCVAGLIVVPWALAFWLSPNVVAVLRSVPADKLAYCFLFGAMSGAGGLAWGLMIRYLGVGLGQAIGCGLCAAVGTLLPPFFLGDYAKLLETSAGCTALAVLLAGVLVSLLGIAVVGAAGISKERELSEAQKKAAVAEFAFSKGLCIAIFSGIMSGGMAFGLRTADAVIAPLTQSTAPLTPKLWQGLPGLVVVLLGGFVVNLVWCVTLNIRNRTGGDYLKPSSPRLANLLFASLAGLAWYSQMVFFTMGDARIGAYKFSGWSVFMSSQIIFSTLWGMALREWQGSSPARARRLLAVGLAILVLSLGLIAYGNFLKPEG